MLALPVALYCCVTFPYGGGIVAGPAAALAGPLAGAGCAFHLGAAAGLYRAGYRWLILLVPALAAALVLLPYGCYLDRQAKEEEYRALVLALRDVDPAPFLARLRVPRSRRIVEDHLAQFLVCAGAESRVEVVDALAALEPDGKEGFALCAVARYGRAEMVRHLLDEGYRPTRAHRPGGHPCQPLLELAAGSTETAPCSVSMLGDFDQFVATPTVEGCRHRAEVARLLIEAGASADRSTPFAIDGCKDAGEGAPSASDGSASEAEAD